ncbi:uncharacterized protein LOC135471506 isoform X2 [Liolophura sinensis]|uniref:uncharacterized protein LOC135471506 isoform X2 n=1 Tax=Liolophura sinensis TaxID=3198878 RepID=UPI0031597442
MAQTGGLSSRLMHRGRFRTPYSRKTNRWLPAALAYYYGREPGARNEVVVLALGIDQYLQAIFHSLDFKKQGCINASHFEAFCEVLELHEESLVSDIPEKMSFREFHARLGEHFAGKYGQEYKPPNVKVEQEEYVSTSVRTKETIQLISQSSDAEKPTKPKFGTFPKEIKVYKKCSVNSLNILDYPTGSLNRNPKWSKRDTQPKVLSDAGSQENKVLQSEPTIPADGVCFLKRSSNENSFKNSYREESECLREIIEDLRGALQSKDAECLAWQVALKHAQTVSRSARTFAGDTAKCSAPMEHGVLNPPKSSKWTDSSRTVVPGYLKSASKEPNGIDMDVKEMASNNKGQEIAKLVSLVNHLQAELNETYKELTNLENHNKLLMDNLDTLAKNYEMTRRLFEVAIVKVKDLEREVSTIPCLKDTIAYLQEERDGQIKDRSRKRFRSRSRGNKFDDVMAFIRRGRVHSRSTDRKSPMGSSRNSVASEETIFCRDVEGKSGSDEEYVHSVGVSRWGSRMSASQEESITMSKLQECLTSLNGRLYQMSEEKRRLLDELQCCKLRNNESRKELEGVEAERARLSVIEERLQESITLLRFLRGKFLSRRTLGKFLLDVVDESYDDPREEFVADKFVEKLLKKLTSSELLKEETYQKLPYSHCPKFSLPTYYGDSSGKTLFKETETLCVL